jgi:pimeloyl-ACP methyl ester carboxylesterase
MLVHGIHAGASSFEWRHTVDALAERHTVVAVDLLGFGRSDRPAIRYSPSLYQALLADLMARIIGERCNVVASSLSAAHVIALAGRDSRHIGAMALIAPTGMGQLGVGAASRSSAQLLLETPILGTTIYNGLTSASKMRAFLMRGYADDRLVTDELVQAYVQCARQPGGKHAVAAFMDGRLDVDVRGALRRVRQPILFLWGDQARQNPVQNAHAFRVVKPDAQWLLVSDAGDMLHDERPEATNAAILRFFERARLDALQRLTPRSNERIPG